MKSIYTLVIILISTLTSFSQQGSYVLKLSNVEVGDKATGVIEIDSIKPNKLVMYRSIYVDSLISITFDRSSASIPFELKNNSSSTIKVLWNEAAYIDYEGNTGKIMHVGVKYIDRNNDQPSTTIIKGAKISDQATPTGNVYFASGSYGGWKEIDLLPRVGKKDTPSLVGSKIKLLLPIMSNDKQLDYIFTFDIVFNTYSK